jgi:hypothetical protein
MPRPAIACPPQLHSLRSRFDAFGVRKLALHLPDIIASSDGSVQCLIGFETGEPEAGRTQFEGPAQGCVHGGRRFTGTT